MVAALVTLAPLAPLVRVNPCKLIELPDMAFKAPTVSFPPSFRVVVLSILRVAVSERTSFAPVVRIPALMELVTVLAVAAERTNSPEPSL